MRKQYLDAMAIARAFGKPDLFITVTCNPDWPEIKGVLLSSRSAEGRLEIVAQVFKLKLKAILAALVKKKVFGKVVAYVYVIEFQKCGLPHMRLLLKEDVDSRPRPPVDYDRFVSTELPDWNVAPRLHGVMTKGMMHGPCGPLNRNALCMKYGKCSKGFPKEFNETTRHDGKGYPLY